MSIVVRLQIFRKIQSQTNDNRILFVGDGQVDRVLLWSLICLCMCRCLSLCRCLSFPPTRWPNYIVQRTWPNWTKIINSIRIVFRDDATGLSTLKHCEKLQSLGVDGSLPVCVSTRVCVCVFVCWASAYCFYAHVCLSSSCPYACHSMWVCVFATILLFPFSLSSYLCMRVPLSLIPFHFLLLCLSVCPHVFLSGCRSACLSVSVSASWSFYMSHIGRNSVHINTTRWIHTDKHMPTQMPIYRHELKHNTSSDS